MGPCWTEKENKFGGYLQQLGKYKYAKCENLGACVPSQEDNKDQENLDNMFSYLAEVWHLNAFHSGKKYVGTTGNQNSRQIEGTQYLHFD